MRTVGANCHVVGAVTDSIPTVIRLSAVSEIRQSVIGRFAVVVADLMSFWARPDEPQHYESMDEPHSSLAGFIEADD